MTPRSNSAALESIELMNGALLRECKVLEIEFELAKQRIKQLEEALDEVYHAGRVGASLRAEKAWIKAKEDKL
jgi:hypothetical protein